MIIKNNIIDNEKEKFDFEAFKREAIRKLKAEKVLQEKTELLTSDLT